VKPIFNTTTAKRLASKQTQENLNLRIANNHEIIKGELVKMVHLGTIILQQTCEARFTEIVAYAKHVAMHQAAGLRERQLQKLDKMRGEVQIGQNRLNKYIEKSKWIQNFSSRVLTSEEVSVLQKGLNFSVIPKTLPKVKIISEIESGIHRLSDSDKDMVRAEVVKTFHAFKQLKPNISRSEMKALQNLKKDDSIFIAKADKGNCTVILNKADYDDKMLHLLSDSKTYTVLKNNPVKKTERLMNSKLLGLKRNGKFDDPVYYNIRSTDACVPRIYGLVKIHKGNLPLRPIVSMIGSPTYHLSKHLASILAPLIGRSGRTVSNSFEFAEFLKTCSWRDNSVMISFDVVSLFTSVPVCLAIEAFRDVLLNDPTLHNRTKLSVDEICDLVDFCLSNTDFSFRGVFYHQAFGCAMGSPVSALAANIVMEKIEKRIFSNQRVKIHYWKRFVDDIWAVVPASEVDDILELINGLEPSIKFTCEHEENKSISFLDLSIFRLEDGSFGTKLYRKPTHTNKYLDFRSNHPLCHKLSVVRTLTDRISTHITNDSDRLIEFSLVKDVLRSNNYPMSVLQKRVVSSRRGVSKPSSKISLPYIRGFSERISRILNRYDIFTIHKPINKLSSIFGLPKDPLPIDQLCGVVYQISCRDCGRDYIGQTGNSLQTRVKQHQAACRLWQPNKSALAEHSLGESHAIDWSAAKVVHRETKWRQRTLAEAAHTMKTIHPLNRCDLFLPAVYKMLLS
jgi:hypothetical protein